MISQCVNHNAEIRLAIIATYPEMSRTLIELAKQESNIVIRDIYASFDDAVKAARNIAPSVDGILSRGATGSMISDAVNIPTVSVPITPFDFMQSLRPLIGKYDRIAFSNFARRIEGIDQIAREAGIELHEYTFQNEQDIMEIIKSVRSKGIPALIGGDVAVRMANKAGLCGIEVISGFEALYQSFHEIIRLIRVRRKETLRAARLNVVLNELNEGIMVTDENLNIETLNPTMLRMFDLSNIDPAGMPVAKLLKYDVGLDALLKDKRPVNNLLRKINGAMLTINHYPVFLNKKMVGAVSTFNDVTKIQKLESRIRNQLYSKGFVAKYTFCDILTNNPQMKILMRMAGVFARSDSSILIDGESGTGKELFAQSIHNASARSKGPFVAINCGALPENLLESELFGYTGGAFTGANKEGKPGLFELAHNGTLFLDEIGEMAFSLQSRLLRVIQEHELMRVGGDKIIPVDVRVISATNKDLQTLIASNQFRKDLYYRLSVFQLKLIPLRDRREDIPLLLSNFMGKKLTNNDRARMLYEHLLPQIKSYAWPGNVRELQNIAQRILLLADDRIDISDIDLVADQIMYLNDANEPAQEDCASDSISVAVDLSDGLKSAMESVERNIIHAAMRKCGQDQSKALSLLRISRSTFWRKQNSADETE